MSNSAVIAIALIAAMLVGVLVIGAGAFGTNVTVSSDEGEWSQWTPPPADGSYGLVVGTYKTKSGLSLLGIDFTPSRWEAQVIFVPPTGCEPTAEQEVVAVGDCSTVPAEGRLAGGGTTEEGLPMWTVMFEVSKSCHEALKTADRWPTDAEACR